MGQSNSSEQQQQRTFMPVIRQGGALPYDPQVQRILALPNQPLTDFGRGQLFDPEIQRIQALPTQITPLPFETQVRQSKRVPRLDPPGLVASEHLYQMVDLGESIPVSVHSSLVPFQVQEVSLPSVHQQSSIQTELAKLKSASIKLPPIRKSASIKPPSIRKSASIKLPPIRKSASIKKPASIRELIQPGQVRALRQRFGG